LARWNWELEIGKWEMGTGNFYFLFSVSRFPFLLYARLQSCKLESLQVGTLARLHVYTLERWNWEMGIGNWEMGNGNWEFLFSVFYFLNCIL